MADDVVLQGASTTFTASADDIGSGVLAQRIKELGCSAFATGQINAGVTAQTLVAARTHRRFVTVVNTSTTITVAVGPATVTMGNGLLLPPGASIDLPTTVLVQVIAASGTPLVNYAEFYDA
jgi:hypothetical protein